MILFFATKIISLSSIICAGLYPIYTFLITFIFDYLNSDYSVSYVVLSTLATLIIGVFVIVKHKSNIGRLIRGK